MDTKPVNPLAGHFRRPSIYFKLPSKGKFWADGKLELPVSGDIPVYPMTNADEITLKTPDALMNGAGIVSVIQSCCPNIRDAWEMPSVDVDAVLIAIRIASYGTNMAITAKCPSCNEEHDYDINLSMLLDKVKCPNFDAPIAFDGLKIKMRPQKYFNVTKTSITQFEEQKIMQALADTTIDDEVRNTRIKHSMLTLLELNDNLLVSGTEYIEIEDGTQVSNPDYIKEFYKNANGQVVKNIEARLNEISKESAIPASSVTCGSCSHVYDIPVEFDYSRFFVTGS